MGRSRRWVGMVGGLACLLILSSCSSDTVRISYRPSVGEVTVYRTVVRAVTVSRVGDQAARRRVTSSVLTARHRVLSAESDGARVEVRLEQEGVAPSTFVVRFDRAGQLAEVQRIEGLPAEVLGNLGLSEILPAAAAAPPPRRLAPGEAWDIDGPVSVAGAETTAARLTGRGRLVALGVADGRQVARVESTYRLPLRRTGPDTDGRFALDGSLHTRARVVYDLDDDQVRDVRATSTGRYAVTLLPPAGVAGVPVPGTLEIVVSTTSRRID